MKVTFEIECENVEEIEKKMKALMGEKRAIFRCHNRLMLLKDVKNAARTWFEQGREPTLVELKNIIWGHVFE